MPVNNVEIMYSVDLQVLYLGIVAVKKEEMRLRQATNVGGLDWAVI